MPPDLFDNEKRLNEVKLFEVILPTEFAVAVPNPPISDQTLPEILALAIDKF